MYDDDGLAHHSTASLSPPAASRGTRRAQRLYYYYCVHVSGAWHETDFTACTKLIISHQSARRPTLLIDATLPKLNCSLTCVAGLESKETSACCVAHVIGNDTGGTTAVAADDSSRTGHGLVVLLVLLLLVVVVLVVIGLLAVVALAATATDARSATPMLTPTLASPCHSSFTFAVRTRPLDAAFCVCECCGGRPAQRALCMRSGFRCQFGPRHGNAQIDGLCA